MKISHKGRVGLSSGFTIVELLIVIVVIAILAAISIVAYRGIQARAEFSVMQSDFETLTKAIELYKINNGTYPNSASCASTGGDANYEYRWCGWSQGGNNSFIPGLAPNYISKTPTLNATRAHRDTYLYQSRSADCSLLGVESYQLIRFNDKGLNSVEMSDSNSMKITDPSYNGYAWGVKSSNCSTWW